MTKAAARKPIKRTKVRRPSRWRSRIVGHGQEAPDQLLANPDNWRIHPQFQQDALAGVIDDIGWIQEVIVNRRTGHVVDGHLRVSLAISHEEPSIPVVYVDLSPDEERAILATLDPLANLAVADKDKLASILADVRGNDRITALLDSIAASYRLPDQLTTGETDPDAVPAPRRTSIKRGHLFELGTHRLLCGDSTAVIDVRRLMAGEMAAMMWTDPPFGVNYTGKTKDKLEMPNDDPHALASLLREAFRQADTVLVAGAPIYVAHAAGALSVQFAIAFEAAGWHFHQGLVWVKDSMVLGHSDYHYKHEPLIYGWKPGHRPWHSGRSDVSVFELPRPKASPDHPVTKPVALVVEHLKNSSVKHSMIYEPFCGSGTTIIAAEQLNRRCYALEIEPRYCQVIIDRWETFTNRKATKLGAM